MAGMSIPPSSVSSFHSTSTAPRTPKKNSKADISQPTTPTSTTQTSTEHQEEGDFIVMTTTIVTTTTGCHSATPQPQSPSHWRTPEPGYHLKTPPSLPLKGKGYRSSMAMPVT
ncbi:uncharacterized protein ARMOST_22493 [Armillaria ostoyae]|uniref:Uncharacterized protein n=1 Tax=Armillaria ostoyae TaxID=47428 RepID=A0A284SD13_ARMOS|nr:uncharacterized protein ARMOST_22493 [Armillaria ostoyae]